MIDVVMILYYNIPKNVEKLFADGDKFYDIQDNRGEGLTRFLELLSVPKWMLEEVGEMEAVLNNGKVRLRIECIILGDFYHYGYYVSVLPDALEYD